MLGSINFVAWSGRLALTGCSGLQKRRLRSGILPIIDEMMRCRYAVSYE